MSTPLINCRCLAFDWRSPTTNLTKEAARNENAKMIISDTAKALPAILHMMSLAPVMTEYAYDVAHNHNVAVEVNKVVQGPCLNQ